MPEPITIKSARSGRMFNFKRISHDLVEIAMIDDGAWLIADPQYTRWLINYILDNPRQEGDDANTYEFSPKPGDMTYDCIAIAIAHPDLARLRAWLEADYA